MWDFLPDMSDLTGLSCDLRHIDGKILGPDDLGFSALRSILSDDLSRSYVAISLGSSSCVYVALRWQCDGILSRTRVRTGTGTPGMCNVGAAGPEVTVKVRADGSLTAST